jgi:hypothetical protein
MVDQGSAGGRGQGLTVSVCGVTLTLRGPLCAALAGDPLLAPFLSGEPGATILDVTQGMGNGSAGIRSRRGQGLLQIRDYNFRGRVFEDRCGTLELAGQNPALPFRNFLAAYVAERLVEQGGLLLHASGVARDGLALAFLGPSGAGKSTVATALAGWQVLSDDLVALRPQGDGAELYGTPFAGEAGRSTPLHAALTACIRLRRDGWIGWRLLAAGQAAATFRAAAPFLSGDPVTEALAIGTAASLARRVPVIEACVEPGRDPLARVRKLLRQGRAHDAVG